MSKELKLPLNEMLKEQERIAIKAIVATAKSTITDTGTNLKATLGQGWELPQEAHAHLYNMDDNKDTFISEFNEYMEKLEEKEIDLRRVYNDRVDELYQKAKQNEAKKG